MVSFAWYNSDNNGEKELLHWICVPFTILYLKVCKPKHIFALQTVFCRVSKYAKVQPHLTNLFSFCHCVSLV